ncbi:hypothetical protein [Moorena sp. SIO3H5]|nr:hypothetical protein [Moorena sp. SIO3H5]NEO70866.1 hypothetical protein [Moorena sp. SIO3H5]
MERGLHCFFNYAKIIRNSPHFPHSYSDSRFPIPDSRLPIPYSLLPTPLG